MATTSNPLTDLIESPRGESFTSVLAARSTT